MQRPGIREQIIKDLEAMSEVAQFLDEHTEMGKRYEFQKMLDEFRKSLLAELDYRREAQNLVTISDNLIDFDAIVIPQPVEDYTTSRVLTMDYIHGRKITDLDPLTRMDIDGAELAGQLFRAYLQQILVDGFFHADPHPGNVFLTDEGQIALLDLGMVARIAPGMQERAAPTAAGDQRRPRRTGRGRGDTDRPDQGRLLRRSRFPAPRGRPRHHSSGRQPRPDRGRDHCARSYQGRQANAA